MAQRVIKSDYLNGAENLHSFYRYSFPNEDYSKLISDRKDFAVDRKLLVRELLEQNRGFSNSQLAMENIQLLARENTFTVTTGHQLVLMGGPMYMLYKIATAIKLAQRIQEIHPEYNIVPVFWMASEDHDWEEINHYHQAFFDKVSYAGTFRGPVGRHVIEPEMEEVLANIPEQFRTLFQPGQDLSTCFRRLILELFGKYGLVIIDADSTALKKTLIPYMEAELEGRGMGNKVIQTSQKLEDSGYNVQILPREFNLFYMGDGDRRLLIPEGDFFISKDGRLRFSKTELLRLIRTQPRDFSPNVSMRPLYQEILLPNLAYIGGWAEMSYWMQLKDAFDAAEVFFPLLVPRMSAALLPKEVANEWHALGFAPIDLETPLHQLKDRYLQQHWDDNDLQSAFAKLEQAYSGLVSTIEGIDKPLSGMAAGQAAKSKKLAEKLQQKIRKSMRSRDPEPYKKIESIKNNFHPDGKKQERVLNFTALNPRDYEEFVDLILEYCPAETYQEQWITLP